MPCFGDCMVYSGIIELKREPRISVDVINKYRLRWRKTYLEEIRRGPKTRRYVSLDSEPAKDIYINRTIRPFFRVISGDDIYYIRTHRMIIYGMHKYSRPLRSIVMKASGYNLGVMLVDKGIVKSIDDLPEIFVRQKIGILDIVDESLDTMKINIYECMSCYGMLSVGMPMCDFEAGIIEGVLEKLYGRNKTVEKYCWGLGYSFCGFESYFE